MKKISKYLIFILIYFAGGLSAFLLRSIIISNSLPIKNYLGESKLTASKEDELHTFWVEKIKEGGYFLHMRHAMREKWDTATAFDAVELQNNDDARKEDYYRAVCLTEKGIIESKLVGTVFEKSGIDVSYVISSPSCRARETAIYAFNRIDQVEPAILHRTAQIRSQHKSFGNKFRQVIDNIELEKGKNVIISGHGGTLSYDLENNVGIVDINEVEDIDSRLETGIIVIERLDGKYIARHKFNVISDISNNSLKLQVEDTSQNKFLFDKNQKYSPKNINKGLIYNRYNSD